MEGLAAAGGVIAVVSIAAQVLQGCNYVRDVFDNAYNAPREIRLLANELAIIEKIVRNTSEIQLHQEELDFCNERISKLCRVVCKYGELENAGRRSKWGKRLAMAMSTEKTQKHLGALREAKGYLENIQNRSAHQKTMTKSHEILEYIEQLSTSQFEAVRIITRSEEKLDDLASITKEMQQALHELANRFVHRDTLASSWGAENVGRLVNAVEKIVQSRLEEHKLQVKDLNPPAAEAKRDLLPVSKFVSADCIENPKQSTASNALVTRKPGCMLRNLQRRILELPEQVDCENVSWNQKDFPVYTEKRSRYSTPMGQILIRTCSTTYSTSSEMAGVELPASLRGWVHPAQFPVTITQTEIVLLTQELQQANGALIMCHRVCGATLSVFNVDYEMKDLNRPARPPFHMRHQATNDTDNFGFGFSTESVIEKLAVGIVQSLRGFLSTRIFSDEKVPYVRAAQFGWKLRPKPPRWREGGLGAFFPCTVS